MDVWVISRDLSPQTGTAYNQEHQSVRYICLGGGANFAVLNIEIIEMVSLEAQR